VNREHAKPCVISAALTGATTPKEKNPALPCTSSEIIDSAVAAWRAGAAMVHIHLRTADGGNLHDPGLYREIKVALKERTGLILNFTTSYFPGMEQEQRFDAVRAEPDMASFNAGSLNLRDSRVYCNSPAFMRRLAEQMREHSVKPEFEIFDTGQIGNVKRMIEEGHFDPPFYFQLVTGLRGPMPPHPQLILAAIDMLPEQSEWVVIGLGAEQLRMNALGMVLGGHARTGFEDNIYYRRGQLARSNAELVARVSRLANELERPPATQPQARELLGLSAALSGTVGPTA
jgi:3-keto-5-aminohexanoate cleavage enzyme